MPVLEKLLHKLHPKDSAGTSQNPPLEDVHPGPPASKPRQPRRKTPILIPPPAESTSYYISSPPYSNGSAGSSSLTLLPSAAIVFAFTHPPVSNPAVAFFLKCLPDPIRFLEKSAWFIRSYLTQSSSSSPRPSAAGGAKVFLEDAIDALRIADEKVKWRHQHLHLVLKDEPGLAYSTDGKIVVSLQWVFHISEEVRRGQRDIAGARKEFEGVLLHEQVHTIQFDGAHSLPGWLVESIADYIRLHAGLGPPHWRKPGQGKRDKGWEDAYDAGARFLDWITGDDASSIPSTSISTSPTSRGAPVFSFDGPGAQANASAAARASVTQYPSEMAFPRPDDPPAGAGTGGKERKRRDPVPDFVRDLNSRLAVESFQESWWEEMCGADLKTLWTEYLDYYGVS